jgi:fimbrial chaperone protein
MKALASVRMLLVATLTLASLPAMAQEFALVVSPPRFEDRTKPGTTYRNVFELNNTSARSAKFSVETADWVLDAQGAPVFSQSLAKDSCRQWVGIEANEITVKGNGKRRFRFEVAVPADAPRGECRFAIMIEGEPQAARANMPLPISGRIGVIVYLAIGDAAPKLVVAETRGVDAQGQRIPALYPQPPSDGAQLPTIVYPLRIKGRLDAERQRLDIDTTLDR